MKTTTIEEDKENNKRQLRIILFLVFIAMGVLSYYTYSLVLEEKENKQTMCEKKLGEANIEIAVLKSKLIQN